MKDLYIIGAGGFGREVAWLAERINEVSYEWDIKGFIDDDESLKGKLVDGYEVLGGCGYLEDKDGIYVSCAVGSVRTRKKIIERISGYRGVSFATLVDPSVILSDRIEIGEGCIICAGTIITVDVTIGRHTIINLDCTVGHDVLLGEYNTLYPSVNASGCVSTGDCVEIGTGVQIIQGREICSNAIFGAGTVVVKDIKESGTYVGVPAKLMEKDD